jgi:TRAP-type C4-dicarboxylate transport system substrate-binding protein
MRLAFVLLLSLSGVAAADEQTLRLGTIVPEGTGWARELRALQRDVETSTDGALKLKWYMGGMAGDEMEMLERVRRGQLDGIVSGGMACETMAPSLRVARIPGLLQTWGETSYVLGRLRPTLDDEAQHHGFFYLGEAIVGPSILFTRRPVASLAEMRKVRFWVWDIDQMLRSSLPDLGVEVLPLPIREALGAYEAGRVDGIVAPAAAALGFQWSAATRYYTDVRFGFVVGCMLIANRPFDALPLSLQKALRVSSAKAKLRIEDVGRAQENQLLGGLFQKQGLTKVRLDEGARVSFFEAARSARDRSASRLVSPGLIARVLGLLADFRSEHH